MLEPAPIFIEDLIVHSFSYFICKSLTHWLSPSVIVLLCDPVA